MFKTVKCDCGYSAKSETDDGLVAEVQKHAKDFHSMEFSREQILAMAQPVPNK